MLLLRSELHCFRQYKKVEVYFPMQGLIGIIGPNGAGKSTLFNSIRWAFFGKVSDITTSLIKNQQAGKEKCYVEHDFLYEGDFYRVHRDTVSSRCFLQKNGRMLAIGTGQVTDEMKKIFRMDHQAFGTCYYAEQDDFDALVQFTPQKRVDMITRLVKIDAIDHAAKKAREDMRAIGLEIGAEENRIEKDEVIAEKEAALEKEKADILRLQQEVQKELREIESHYQQKMKEKKEQDILHQQHNTLTHERHLLTQKIQHIQERSLREYEEKQTDLLQKEKRWHALQDQRHLYTSLLEEKEALSQDRITYLEQVNKAREIKQLEIEIADYVAQLQGAQKAIDNLRGVERQLEATEQQLEEAKANILTCKHEFDKEQISLQHILEKQQDIQEQKTKFESLGSDTPCPTCERPLGEHAEGRIHSLSKSMEALSHQREEIKLRQAAWVQKGKKEKEIYTTLQQRKEAQKKQVVEKNKYDERILGLQKEIGEKQEKVASKQQDLAAQTPVTFDEARYASIMKQLPAAKKIYDEVLRLETDLEQLPIIQQKIDDAKKEIATSQQEVEEKDAVIAQLSFDEKQYVQMEHDLDTIRTSLSGLQQKQHGGEADYRVWEDRYRQFLVQKEENEERKRVIEEKKAQQMLLAKLDEMYKDYRYDILQKLSQSLTDVMSSLMSTITDGKYDEIELDKQFNIHIYRDGVKNPLSFYSGGERKLAALILRLAISNLLVSQTGQANFDLLAMDEVFGAMDQKRQDSILDTLRRLNDVYKQILMVTHSEAVKDGFDHILEITQDEEGFSRTRWSTEWDEEETKAFIASCEKDWEAVLEEEEVESQHETA